MTPQEPPEKGINLALLVAPYEETIRRLTLELYNANAQNAELGRLLEQQTPAGQPVQPPQEPPRAPEAGE